MVLRGEDGRLFSVPTHNRDLPMRAAIGARSWNAGIGHVYSIT
jgi:hypothetical protein